MSVYELLNLYLLQSYRIGGGPIGVHVMWRYLKPTVCICGTMMIHAPAAGVLEMLFGVDVT